MRQKNKHRVDPGDSTEPLRATGRTGRMLEFAVDQARAGRYVLIYCVNRTFMVYLTLRLVNEVLEGKVEMMGIPKLGAKVRIGDGVITFERVNENFDWHHLRGRGVRPDVICLMDHWEVERKLPPRWLEMLYRFVD